MTVDDLMNFHGAKTPAELARKMGRHRSVIHWWEKNGIPERTQALIEVRTKGQLKAEQART